MVMILSTNYTNKAQSTSLAGNADAKQEKNCWRDLKSDGGENIGRKGENFVSSSGWRNGEMGDLDKTGKIWRRGEKSSKLPWKNEGMDEGRGRVLRKREGDPERSLWRNEKSKSLGSFWDNGENKAMDFVWESCSNDEIDSTSIFWRGKKEVTTSEYIWRNPAGQRVSPINSQTDVSVEYVSNNIGRVGLAFPLSFLRQASSWKKRIT